LTPSVRAFAPQNNVAKLRVAFRTAIMVVVALRFFFYLAQRSCRRRQMQESPWMKSWMEAWHVVTSGPARAPFAECTFGGELAKPRQDGFGADALTALGRFIAQEYFALRDEAMLLLDCELAYRSSAKLPMLH
jgi:hypothetical protein